MRKSLQGGATELKVAAKKFAQKPAQLMLLFSLLALGILSHQINFLQNDEYMIFNMVNSFMNLDFQLDPYIGHTFYVQGLLGAAFSAVFGISNMHYLTALISSICVYIFALILERFYKTTFVETLLLSLLFLVNPIFVYSSLGIMSENYFLLFFLAALYFIHRHLDGQMEELPNRQYKNLLLSNFFIILSYFVRQVGIVTSLAFAIALLFKRRFREFFIQLGLSVFLIVYHLKFFPLTPAMYETTISPEILFNFGHSLNLLMVMLMYASMFCFPVMVGAIIKGLMSRERLLLLVLMAISVITFLFFVNKNFDPGDIIFTNISRDGKVTYENVSKIYPYLENVLKREGFLPKAYQGTKYNFRGYFDLYSGLETISKFSIIIWLMFVPLIIKHLFKLRFNALLSSYFFGYLLMLILSPKVYDRYLLTVFPICILLFLQFAKELPTTQNGTTQKWGKVINRIGLVVLTVWVAMFFFISYLYSMDHLSINNYVWNKSRELVESGTPPNKVRANHSWDQLYPNPERDWKYQFSYLETDKNEDSSFRLVETHEVEFPLNMYISPKVGLYEKAAE